MPAKPKPMKPGDLQGKRGDEYRRITLNGCVWHQHLKNKEYRCKVVGEELWLLQAGEKVDSANIRAFKRLEAVGLELVSKMEHWWLDKEIKWPELQQGDWDFAPIKDSRYEWQWAWAWQYECLREWQPWSDFDYWRGKWSKEVKRLRDPAGDWIRGSLTKEEAECDASFSYGERLPLWLLREFAKFFPQTPWVKIPDDKREGGIWSFAKPDKPIPRNPDEKRKELEKVSPPGDGGISLDGSLLALKEPNPSGEGLPPIPEKLRIENNGIISLRQPDPNNAEEMALYAEYQRKKSEALQHHREWLDAPGRYRDEVVKEITPGQFSGTYIIHIPWYHTDDDLKTGFASWLRKKESELPGKREKSSHTGWDKRYADLKQLAALRLLRSGMTAEEARSHTEKTCGKALYERPSEWSDAKKKADDNLTAFYLGVA
jgi:hypothetical protein